MKVLHAVHHFHPCLGGLERAALDACTQLVKRGHKVRVSCLDKCTKSKEKLADGEFNGIEVRRHGFLDLFFYKVAPGILRDVKGIDLVHVHGIGFFSDWLLLTKFLHRRPVVVSTHGGVFHTKALGPIKWVYFHVIQRLLLGMADKVLAVSKNDLELFSRVSGRVQLLENAIDTDLFRPRGVPDREQMVFVGRLSKNKRVDRLIEAMGFLAGRQGRARLIVAGEDTEGLRKKLEKRAASLGLSDKVFFAGKCSDKELVALFNGSRYFVSASEYEGFGLTLIEAMACGCIPIVNNIDSFKNLVEPGKNGYLVDFSRPELAAEMIKEIKGKSGKELGRVSGNALSSAEKFSWPERAKELENAYQSVL